MSEAKLLSMLHLILPLTTTHYNQPDSLCFESSKHNIGVVLLLKTQEVCFTYHFYNDEDYSQFCCSYETACDHYKQCIIDTLPPQGGSI